MVRWLKHLKAFLQLKPAGARSCEFCGGIKCVGACSTVGAATEPQECLGRLDMSDPFVGYVYTANGDRFSFNRQSQAGQDITGACQHNDTCRITATVRKTVIKTVLHIECITTPAKDPVSQGTQSPQ